MTKRKLQILDTSKAVVILGVLLALGMSAAAFIFGVQAKHIGAGKQTIAVKGLAEKPIAADYAEWSVGLRGQGNTFADALAKLRKERPALDEFLAAQGFAKDAVTEGNESVTPNMVEEDAPGGRTRQVQRGFNAAQDVLVTSKDLPRIEAAHKAALQFEAEGHPVHYEDPLFLVSNLEDIKMSLIGAATQNAQQRAAEFAKNGNAKVGTMRSASQGAFYILPAGASVDSGDYGYGGTYDKTTVAKTARVVVTIDYNIEN
jgi:hypothetical protein